MNREDRQEAINTKSGLDLDTDVSLASLSASLLQKDPADRYQTARELHSDLEEIDTPTLRMTLPQPPLGGHVRSRSTRHTAADSATGARRNRKYAQKANDPIPKKNRSARMVTIGVRVPSAR